MQKEMGTAGVVAASGKSACEVRRVEANAFGPKTCHGIRANVLVESGTSNGVKVIENRTEREKAKWSVVKILFGPPCRLTIETKMGLQPDSSTHAVIKATANGLRIVVS